MEVAVSSTSIPSTAPLSTSIQDVLKLTKLIKRKRKRQYKKINFEIFTSDEVLEMYEKDDQKLKNKENEIEEKKKIGKEQKIMQESKSNKYVKSKNKIKVI